MCEVIDKSQVSSNLTAEAKKQLKIDYEKVGFLRRTSTFVESANVQAKRTKDQPYRNDC